MTKGPVLIELDAAPAVSPAEAPPVADLSAPETPVAMERAVQIAARGPSLLGRWFWRLTLALLGLVLSVAAWDFTTGLLASNTVLGGIAIVLVAGVLGVLLLIGLREAAGFARLRRMDGIRRQAAQAVLDGDLRQARAAVDRILTLYSDRAELRWSLDRVKARKDDVFDPEAAFALVETEVFAPLDRAAEETVAQAARQVAAVTAMVPLALADLVTALVVNLRMIRQIAEIYGGRSGPLGNWRLNRSVMAHLVTTGAVAVGDDMVGHLAGGGIVSKISRRFGEGVINGALTARVGVAAIEVCRPLGFSAVAKPSVSKIFKRAMTGLFQSKT